MRKLVIGITLLAAACAQSAPAPPVGDPTTVCTDAFCMEVPAGWGTVDEGDGFVTLVHTVDPDGTSLTVGLVNMEAIVTSSGGTWPVPTADVVTAFWSLLEDAGVGSYTRSQRMVGGAVRSWGKHETGAMWQLMYPLEGPRAIGVDLRAPNDSWEPHADVVFTSLRPAP